MKEEVIKKGRHASGYHFKPGPYWGNEVIKFNFMLTDSAFHFYPSADIFANEPHIIGGIAFGTTTSDSARLGFINNVKTKTTQLASCIYNRGIYMSSVIGTIRPRQEYSVMQHHHFDDDCFDLYVIEKDTGNSVIEQDFKIVELVEVPFIYPAIRIGYYQWPFWGLNHVAPHDVKIKMQYL